MITINIDKAKAIAHDKRREARSAEFAPLDIKATIPSEATAAEAARQAVRDKYAAMQTAIDSASTVDEIKAAMRQQSGIRSGHSHRWVSGGIGVFDRPSPDLCKRAIVYSQPEPVCIRYAEVQHRRCGFRHLRPASV